jgi:hypothetical protein
LFFSPVKCSLGYILPCFAERAELNVQMREPRGTQLPFEFVDLTENLWQAYQDEPEKWRERLYPSRLLGVVEKAQAQFDVKDIKVFVTKQEPIHESDSFYLFNILKQWFEDCEDIRLTSELIPATINPSRDADELANYYYKQIQAIDRQDILLISRKGGTPAMSNTLNQQVILSSIERKIILIDPQLAVDRILSGQVSNCELTSYWKYIRVQKYEAVKQLLERWDFDGAIEILKDWQKYLKFLIEQEVIDRDIENSSELIRLVLQRLDIGRTYFNLDSDLDRSLSYRIASGDDLGNIKEIKDQYSKVLNLYTQCIILWDLNQVANFSFRMSSLCEEILHDSLDNLGAAKYFNKQQYPHDWYITKSQVESTLWNTFYQLEIQANPHTQLNYWKWNEKPSYKLPGRFSKRNFLSALIEFRGNSTEQTAWQAIENHLIQLDYWIDLRNSLTHSAQGFSKKSMADSLAHDRNLYQRGDRDRTAERANSACKRDDILPTLTSMMTQMSVLLGRDVSPYIGLQEPYYIYSDIKQWVLDKLQQEGLD